MSNFSLAPYTIRIRHKRSSQCLTLNNIPSVNTVDLLDIFYDYLNNVVPATPIDPNNREFLKINSLNKASRTINGMLEAGESGFGAKLLDTTTDAVSYERKAIDAELIPYYFIIRIPTNVDKGLVILQRFKNFGIKTLVFDSFEKHLKSLIGDDYILEVNPLVPKELIRSYIRGQIVKLRLIKQGYPRDIFDVADDATPDDIEFDGTCELVLSARKNGTIPQKLHSMLSRKIDDFLDAEDISVGSLIEVKNFDFDTIKIQVRVGTSYRTINLSHLNRLKYYEDISGIDVDINNHPKFAIIDIKAKEFLNDLAHSIWGGNLDV